MSMTPAQRDYLMDVRSNLIAYARIYHRELDKRPIDAEKLKRWISDDLTNACQRIVISVNSIGVR